MEGSAAKALGEGVVKYRRMGFLGFVLVWGLGQMGLLNGLPCTLAMGVLVWMWERPSATELLGKGLLSLSLWIPVGVWLGVWVWFDTEKRYEQMVREVGREPPPPGTSEDHDRG